MAKTRAVGLQVPDRCTGATPEQSARAALGGIRDRSGGCCIACLRWVSPLDSSAYLEEVGAVNHQGGSSARHSGM